MSTKIKARKSGSGNGPGNQGKEIDRAAYNRLGARLGYIAGQFLDQSKQADFEQEFGQAVTEAISVDAPANALAVLDGFRTGYAATKKS